MDIILCLQKINPNVGWSVNANDYNQITCSDASVQIPTLAQLESAWVIVGNNTSVLQQISQLESTITPRRQREAILGIDNGWLANVDAQIAQLRAQLK